MNIMLISYLFPPITNPQSILSARLAKYLRRAGHSVFVVAGNNVGIFNSSHGVDNTLCEDLNNGVEIRYVSDRRAAGIFTNLKEKLVYHEHYGYWVDRVLEEAVPIVRRISPDVVYSLSAPYESNVAGMRLCRKTGITWVAHFSDPLFLSYNLKFKSPLRTYLTNSLERDLLRLADGITFVNQNTLLKSTEFHPAYREKCIVLPHSYDPDYFPSKIPPRAAHEIVKLTYVGSLYSRRNPFGAIRAMEQAAARRGGNPGFEFHLYGSIESSIRNILARDKKPWVIMHGPVRYRESISAMLESDYLLLIDMPDETNLFTPSKLIDYLAAQKPIIGITNPKSDSARILRDVGYPVTSPEDLDGLVSVFSKLLSLDTLGISASHQQVAQDYRADTIAGQLVRFLENRVKNTENTKVREA